MFVDRARVLVLGGAGGNGCCSFRREKYVPYGGPDGGDGGEGGDVYFVAKAPLTSLLDVHFHSRWKGESGAHGRGANCHGKNGADLIIPVPPGTIIRDLETGEAVGDLVEDGQRFVAARGGRGGKGNARFTSSTHRAPKFAERGEPGEDHEYLLELKLIAEVGLIGLPNAGKSTFLAAVSAAHPKIGNYPFTTLSPNLGVAVLSDYRTMTVADIPGIIEGAANGKGLGHDFLRHIERTKVLVFLVDSGDEDPAATLRVLESELEQHSPVFAKRPRVVVLNKIDIPENRERAKKLACGKSVKNRPFSKSFLVSTLTHEGMGDLLEHLWTTVDCIRREPDVLEASEPERTYTFERPYIIEETQDGFRIAGKTILRIARMTDFENREGIRHFHMKLQRMGILKALKRMGAQEGQSIHIGDVELEYQVD